MTLKLVISKKPFDVMITGEKLEEFHVPSKWIESCLFDKSTRVDLNGVDIGSDKGLELRLAGQGGRADTASMHAYDRRARCPPPRWTSGA